MSKVAEEMVFVMYNGNDAHRVARNLQTEINPTWVRFMRFCAEMGHGDIEKLRIQDGLPVLAELTTRKVRFDP